MRKQSLKFLLLHPIARLSNHLHAHNEPTNLHSRNTRQSEKNKKLDTETEKHLHLHTSREADVCLFFKKVDNRRLRLYFFMMRTLCMDGERKIEDTETSFQKSLVSHLPLGYCPAIKIFMEYTRSNLQNSLFHTCGGSYSRNASSQRK